MALTEFIELVPEDKREAFKTEVDALSKRVDLEEFLSKEDNLNSLMQKDFFSKKLQSESDRKKDEFEKKFMSEKVPALLEAERKKGEKKDWEIRIEQLEAEKAAETKERIKEKQINKALSMAQEAKIPSKLVDRFIGETDEETETQIKALAETLTAYKDEAVQTALKTIGVQPKPTGGQTEEPKDLKEQLEKAYEEGNADKVLMIQGKIERQQRSK